MDADDWVADICDAVDDLNEVENAGMADLEEAYSDAYYEEDGDLYRDAVIKYTRDYGKALDRFARDAEDAGEPDVEGGEEIAAAVQDYVKKEQRAFERVSREVKALKQTGAEVVTVPSVALGLVVVRTSDNRVAAFETDTGKRRWTFQRQNPPLVLRQTSAIAMDASTAYVGLPGGRLVALSLETGALRWESAVALPRGSNEIERIADVVGTPLISGREICAATFQGRVGCFDTASGRALWGRELSSPSGLDLDGRLLVVPDDRGDVHAFARSGASLWRQDKLRQRGLSAPLLMERMVLVGDRAGLVHALSRDDGAIAARLSTDDSPIVAAPVAADGLAVVQTAAGSVYALRVE